MVGVAPYPSRPKRVPLLPMPTVEELQAQNVALVLWALLFVLIYRKQTLYYLIFCGVLVAASGAWTLEYAPSLWLPVAFVLGVYDFFKRTRSGIAGRRKVS